MKNKLLEVKKLSKNYHTKMGEVKAIDNISFDVYEGEFLCIIGPSGCGKSTVLNILANPKQEIKSRVYVTRRCFISLVKYIR